MHFLLPLNGVTIGVVNRGIHKIEGSYKNRYGKVKNWSACRNTTFQIEKKNQLFLNFIFIVFYIIVHFCLKFFIFILYSIF